ncbi:MAG: T9SS type A sorting domain-containing protein, partial [Calditrichales bacterium]
QIFANTFNGIVARWENDAAYPGIAIDLSGETGNSRALEVVGSGANTTVFVGKGTDIRTFEGDGEGGFTENTARRINAVFADEVDAIAAENADTLWVANNASAAGSRLVYVWNGAAYVADAAAAAALPFKAFVAQGLAVDPADQLYMLAEAGGAMDGIAVGLFDGTNLPPEPSSLDSDGDGVYDAAGRINSASLVTDVAVDRANNTVYWTSAGGSGGIGLLKVNFPQFPLMTFAEARVDDNGDFMPDMLNDTVRVVGVITSPNYQSGSRSEHYFQDATAGLDLYFSGGNLGLNIGDEVEVVGVMAQYNGLAEIVPLSTGDVTVLSSGNSVVPVVITPAELNEDVEGQLVRMDSVWLTDPSAWPAEGSNRSVYFTDGIDTVMMYVDRDTDLDGWVPPQGLMNLISVAGQFSTATPPNDGYQIRGTLQEHFIDLSPEVALDPDSLGFGEMAINGHHTLMVKFKNMGTTPVVIDSIRFGTEYFSSAMADSAIAGQDSADIPVTFSPMMTDPVEDVMTIHTPVASFEVVVTGSGYELFPLVWRMHADSTGSEWFFTEAAQHMVRNIAYNPVSRHLLVASRVGGSKVWAIDQATGDTVKSLNTSIITGGGYYINLLACTEDGQIIVGNLAYSSGQPFKLYYYADEDADPVVAYDGTFDVFGARVGDALAVSGSGNDVKVYVSGSGNSNVNVLTLSDGVATRGTDIALPEASAARYGIAPVAHGDYIFTNGPGITPRYIKADGTVLHEFDTAVIPSGTNVTYFEVPTNSGTTRHFIGITNGYSSGTSVVELLGTPGDELCSSYNLLAAPTENYATNGNANATGAAVYNTGLNSLVEMITNNGISSYDFSVVEGDAITAILNTDNIIPEVYSLSQNYPNPFNPTTSVDVSLPKTGLVKILIYNILGQEVMSVFNGQLTAGNHSFMIDASSLSSGVYVYRIQADGFTAAKKMVLMK